MCSYQDPFEEYKERRQKKLAKRAEAEENAKIGRKEEEKKNSDDINWFGTKVGMEAKALGGGVGGGVGKYLNAAGTKRPALEQPSRPPDDVGVPDESKKRRKIGFGNFEGW